MKIHQFSTGQVKVTESWRVGRGTSSLSRLANALFDKNFTEWLPVYCTLIEDSSGLILVDTGVSVQTTRPVWFPPYIRLLQRAVPFQIEAEQEIGPVLKANGFDPADIRTVVMTHLHQDHDGGLHQLPNAEFLVARAEWQAASGLGGRLGGYLNHLWPSDFSPTLIDFIDEPYHSFPQHLRLTDRVVLVPSPGHSAGHLSVIIEFDDHIVFLGGDASYTQELMLKNILDGVSGNPQAHSQTLANIRELAAAVPTVYLPSHDPDAGRRLAQRETVPVK